MNSSVYPQKGTTNIIVGWDNDSTFYVGFCNKRPFTMVSESYLGSGVVRFEYEFQND